MTRLAGRPAGYIAATAGTRAGRTDKLSLLGSIRIERGGFVPAQHARQAPPSWVVAPTKLSGRAGLTLLSAYSQVSAPDPDRFAARVKGMQIGSMTLMRIRSNSMESSRSRGDLQHSESSDLYITIPWHGRHDFVYDGVERTVTPGGMYLIRTDRPHQARLDGPNEALHLGLPQSTVQTWGLDPDLLCAHPLPVTPVARALAHLGEQVARLAPPADRVVEHLLERSVLDMLHATLRTVEGRHPVTMPATAIRSRAVAVIDALYADPDLTPPSIANRLGISLRHLHRAFQDTPDGVAAVLRERRLTAAAELLVDPSAHRLPIGSVAGFVGIREPSFRRAFTQRFGLNPSDYRANHTPTDPER